MIKVRVFLPVKLQSRRPLLFEPHHILLFVGENTVLHLLHEPGNTSFLQDCPVLSQLSATDGLFKPSDL